VTLSPGIGIVPPNLPLICPNISLHKERAYLRIQCLPIALIFLYGRLSKGIELRLLIPSTPVLRLPDASSSHASLSIVNLTKNLSVKPDHLVAGVKS
jgi:hypothetical protein